MLTAMDTHTTLPPDTDEPVIDHFVSIIIQAVEPEIIFLVSKYAECIFTEHIFNTPHHPFLQEVSYELVVVVPAREKRTESELQDIIESRCQVAAPVTALILPEHKFRQLMESGHPFINRLIEKAQLLHHTGLITLGLHAPEPLYTVQNRKAEFEQRLRFVQSCMEGVSFYRLQQQLTMAAFLLHQAAEHLFTALLHVITAYRMHTHNLDKLLRYTRCFSIELTLLFPRNTPEEQHLFQLLQKAYIDARYKPDYQITEAELQVLSFRVHKMLSYVQQTGSRHIGNLTG